MYFIFTFLGMWCASRAFTSPSLCSPALEGTILLILTLLVLSTFIIIRGLMRYTFDMDNPNRDDNELILIGDWIYYILTTFLFVFSIAFFLSVYVYMIKGYVIPMETCLQPAIFTLAISMASNILVIRK